MKRFLIAAMAFGCGSNWVPCDDGGTSDSDKPRYEYRAPADLATPICIRCCPLMEPDMSAPPEPCTWEPVDDDKDNEDCRCDKPEHNQGQGVGHCSGRPNKRHSHRHGMGHCFFDCD